MNVPAAPILSVIVPTYREAANVPVLFARLKTALAGLAWEMIVVDDDSPDGTADIAFGDYANMFYAQEQSRALHLLALADGYDAGPNVVEVLTLPGSKIVTPKPSIPPI